MARKRCVEGMNSGDTPSAAPPVISIDSLDRLARVAKRGLPASAVMIGGSAIASVLAADEAVDDDQRRTLELLCRRIERSGDDITHEPSGCLGIPLHHPDGRIAGALCAFSDGTRPWNDEDRALLADLAALFENEATLGAEISLRRAAEETSELVTHELSHRIKNIFAVITSLVTLSARPYPEARAFARSVGERISALGRANDYVRPHIGGSSRPPAPSLLSLIEALTVPYQETDRPRIRLEGDDAPVGRLSVTTLALILHELATNAVKYGALSRPDGEVTIRCTKGSETLMLVWQEHGGPSIPQPPTRQGFGTVLSQRAATVQLGAAIHHDWHVDGLVLCLEIPLQRLAN